MCGVLRDLCEGISRMEKGWLKREVVRVKNLLLRNPSLMDSIALYWASLFLMVLRLEEQVVVCPVKQRNCYICID